MTNSKYNDLMNRDIDGLITPEEQADLRRFLAGNAEASAYYNELVQVSARLKSVRMVEPPADLKQSILHRLPIQTARPPQASPNSYFHLLTRWFVPSPSTWMASGAVVGAAIMLFAFTVFHQTNNPSTEGVRGTLAPIEQNGSPAIDQKQIVAGGSVATIQSRRHGKNIVVSIQVNTREQAVVELFLDRTDIVVTGISGLTGTFEPARTDRDALVFAGTGAANIQVTFLDLSASESHIQVNLSQGSARGSEFVKTGTF